MSQSIFPNPHPRNARLWHGKRVGILGGSFFPPHQGHKLIAMEALKKFSLDAVWWMVSPQNPLKSKASNFPQRLQMTRDFVKHPHMVVTDIEQKLGTDYSYKTVVELKRRFPKTDFIWIAGMDNAVLFHRWNDWKKLAEEIPFVFFNRPPGTMKLNQNKIRMLKGRKHIVDVHTCQQLAPDTIYWMYKGQSKNISSTQIRAKKGIK